MHLKQPYFLGYKMDHELRNPQQSFIQDSSQLSDHNHFLSKKSDSAMFEKDYSRTNGVAVESGITNSVLRGD